MSDIATRDARRRKDEVVEALVVTASPENRGWYRDYLEGHYESLVTAVRERRPLDHGFRGLEVQDAMRQLGLW